MIYVTNGYITNQFETEEQALNHIKAEMDEEELSYKAVFDHTEGNVRVIVFHTTRFTWKRLSSTKNLISGGLNHEQLLSHHRLSSAKGHLRRFRQQRTL